MLLAAVVPFFKFFFMELIALSRSFKQGDFRKKIHCSKNNNLKDVEG